MNPNSTTGSADMDKIELVQLVEIDNTGTASLGEIIELYSSDDDDDEGAAAGPSSSSAGKVIQIDCSDQAFADLLRLNVGVPMPTATAGAAQMTATPDNNVLQILAGCTNGLVTTTGDTDVKAAANHAAIKGEKPKALVKPLISGPKPRICLNLDCQNSTSTMKKAGSVELYCFGYPERSKNKWICDSCDELAREYKENLAKALEEKRSVFTVPTPWPRLAQGVIVIDDDEEDDEDSTEEGTDETTYVVPANIDEIIDDIIRKVDVNAQRHLCINYLQGQLDDLVNWLAQNEIKCGHVERELEEKKKLLEASRQKYKKAMLRPIDIDVNGHVTVMPIESSEPSGSGSMRATAVASRSVGTATQSGLIKKEQLGKIEQKIKDESEEVVTLGVVVGSRPKLELSPTPDPIPRIMPKPQATIYGMKYTAKNYWLPGTIIDTRKNIFNTLEFKVQFETTKKGRPLPDSNPDPKNRTISVKYLSPKHIAYSMPCPFVLPVGTRVIARFKTDQAIPYTEAGFYFAGVIAEQPRNINGYRYLIFFDDGYAQYVGQHDVLLVCESSKEVWLDVHPDSQQFIRSYLLTYPEKAMLRLNKSSQVSIEYNGAWYSTLVVEVDASLVRLQFEKIKRSEWVYRGSPRLYPIFMKDRRHRQGTVSMSPAIRRNESKIPIEYPDDDVLLVLSKGEPMAKKRTSLPPATAATAKPQLPLSKSPAPVPAPATPIMNTASLSEFEGKLVKFRFTMPRPGPRPFVEHECGPNCVEKFDPTLPELKQQQLTPLLQPMYFNWSREIGKYPKRHVYYRAPCGVRLRHYGELEEFLEKTGCGMGIEYFCYDLVVHPYAEFIARRQLYSIKDLSYGRENVPVHCINSIDHDYPDFVHYTATRIPWKGVTINLDDDFLACCDCTDNCLDKEKCSCWKLTAEGAKFTSPHGDSREIGYEQRRLHQHVISGIYECNKKCKCRNTCSNRVAQNPLKWKLQVFKTSTKGWGVRPLNDIPTGSFICAYAGQLLNEISANEDGKTQGDEYLAELDYIEVIENFKEGYEADVVDPEQQEQMKDDPDFKIDSDEETEPATGFFKRPGGDSSDEEALSTRRPSRFNPTMDDDSKATEKKYKPTRKYFGEDESCYIMDAKTRGNIGRYLNHSCEPNVFVQNVFVDTHDLRFPWVCFFAYKYIRAGTELTWDYNYDIGSVPGKTLYCYCAAPTCRARLL